MNLDTPLGRLIHARKLVPLEALRQAVDDARAEQADGGTLLPRLVARGLLTPEVADELARHLEVARADTLPTAKTRPAEERWVPGAVAGDYRVVRELGQGGMGTVFEAVHLPTNARRALKTLPLSREPTLLLRFQREAEMLALVDGHPNVVRVHATFQALGAQVLVMDLLPGDDLLTRIEKGPLPPAETVRIGVGLARGLEHLHRRGVLHRDLKPNNIMFDEQGEPRLVDFGLARTAEAAALTASGAVVGTPAYMAPEQAKGERDLVPATDVYGLGALLFHAVTGRPPFEGSLYEVLAQVWCQPPPSARALAPAVPEALDLLLQRALAKRREDRPASAAAFGEALAASLAPVRRDRRPLLAAAGAGALVVVALAVAVTVGRSGPPTPIVAATEPAPTDSRGWTRAWTLEDGPPPRLAPAALWLDGEAAPLDALRDDEALRAAFDGEADRRGDGRVRVRYEPAALRTWSVLERGAWSITGPRPAGQRVVRDERETTLLADRWPIHLRLGAARWRDASLALALKVPQEARPDEPFFGTIVLALGEDDVAEERWTMALRGNDGGAQDLGVDPRVRRRSLAVYPGGPPGERLRIDDKVRTDCDEALATATPPGAAAVLVNDTPLAVSDVVVTGRPLATDVPARAWPPTPGGRFARVEARFALRPGDAPPTLEGGPFVALGEGPDELRLELRGWRVLLTHGELPVAVVATVDSSVASPALEGRLSLERAPDQVRCEARIGAARGSLVLLAPAPLPGSGVPSYGSGGRRVGFGEVEVHTGPADAERSRFDAQGEGTGLPRDGRGLWRAGAARLQAALRLDDTGEEETGEGETDEAKVEAAARAAVVLEAAVAAGGLDDDEARDALARALLARILTGGRAESLAALERLVARAGSDAAAGRVFAALAWRKGVPAFDRELADRLRTHDVPVDARPVALEVAERLVPSSRGRLQLRRALQLMDDERYADALAGLEEARALGVPAEQLDAPMAAALLALGRAEEAIPVLEREVRRDPTDADQRIELCDALGRVGAPPQVRLEHALIALMIDRRSVEDLERLEQLTDASRELAPGLVAAAWRCRVHLELQTGAPPPSLAPAASARDRNLEAWARGARPLRDDRADAASFYLAEAVERDYLDALVIDEVAAALRKDDLVRALAICDPRLKELRPRLQRP